MRARWQQTAVRTESRFWGSAGIATVTSAERRNRDKLRREAEERSRIRLAERRARREAKRLEGRCF